MDKTPTLRFDLQDRYGGPQLRPLAPGNHQATAPLPPIPDDPWRLQLHPQSDSVRAGRDPSLPMVGGDGGELFLPNHNQMHRLEKTKNFNAPC